MNTKMSFSVTPIDCSSTHDESAQWLFFAIMTVVILVSATMGRERVLAFVPRERMRGLPQAPILRLEPEVFNRSVVPNSCNVLKRQNKSGQ